MRRFFIVCAGLTLAAVDVNAGTLIPVVPVFGDTLPNVRDIDDSNNIVGGYVDPQGVTHAFVGTLDGNYVGFDGGANGSFAVSIDNQGYITGIANTDQSDGTKVVPFERFPNGTIVNVTKHGKQVYGGVGGINNFHQTFVGSQWSQRRSRSLGYFGKAGERRRALTLSGDYIFTAPRDVNRSGVVVGWAFPPDVGFVLKNGVTTTVVYPDESQTQTQLFGINDKGLATGDWFDSEFVEHGLLFDVAGGSFTPFDAPGASYTDLGKPNNAGYFPVNTDIGTYIYCPKRPAKCPGNGQEILLKSR